MPLSQRLCRDTCTGIAALWNAVHAHSTWCHQVNLWKRLRQLNHTQDSREEEPKSIVSEGNSRENLGRLNATWYLTTSNIFHYEILLIYLGHSTYTGTPIFQSVMECIGLIFKWTQRERNPIHFEIWEKVMWDKKKKITPQTPVDGNWPFKSHHLLQQAFKQKNVRWKTIWASIFQRI